MQVAPSPTQQQDIDAEVRGLIRQIGEEARNIDRSLGKLVLCYETPAGPTTPAANADTAWATVMSTFDRDRQAMAALLSRVGERIDQNAAVREWWGAEITRIANYWADVEGAMQACCDDETPPGLQELVPIRRDIDELVFEAGALTVPYELENYLKNYRPGQVLSFEKTFRDQFPRAEIRQRILDYIYNQPLAVSGIVDPVGGTITSISNSPWRRALSWLGALLALAVVLVACWLLPRWNEAPLLADDVTGRQLAGSALLVLLGTAGHVAVGAIKDLRRAVEDDRRRFTSIGNWLLWVHAREVQVAVGILTAGVLTYVVAGTRSEQDPLTLLAVGYSADSLVDVLLPKFGKAVLDRTEKVRAALI